DVCSSDLNRQFQTVSRLYAIKFSILLIHGTTGLPAGKIADIKVFGKRKVLFLKTGESSQRIGGFYGGIAFQYKSRFCLFFPVSPGLGSINQISDPTFCKSIKLCRPDLQTNIFAAVVISDLYRYRKLLSKGLQSIPDIFQISHID